MAARLKAICLLLMLWSLTGAAAGEEGDFAAIVRGLVEQYLGTGVPEEAREDSCWLESDAMIRAVAFTSFLNDERLKAIGVEEHLEPIRQALRGPLAELDPLVAVDVLGHVDFDASRFTKLLKKMKWSRPPNWRSPELVQAIRRAAAALSELRAREAQLSLSGRYRKKWTFDVSAVWFPYTRKVSLYLIGSSECLIQGRTKSATLRLKGLVRTRLGPNGERVHSVVLDGKPEFVCRGCELELTGRWTDRRQPADGSRVSLSNILDLTVDGSHASGRITQDVIITSGQGAVTGGRLVYRMEGRVSPEGQLDGTFEATGDRRAIWLDNAPDKLRGTWTGKIDAASGRAMGTVDLKGKASFPWEGAVKR